MAIRFATRLAGTAGLRGLRAASASRGLMNVRSVVNQGVIAPSAGVQARFMSDFQDQYNALAEERAAEQLVPKPLDAAQTAQLVGLLKVRRAFCHATHTC